MYEVFNIYGSPELIKWRLYPVAPCSAVVVHNPIIIDILILYILFIIYIIYYLLILI
jgi:hypothetical protein